MTMLCLGFVHIVHGLLEREMLSAVYDCTIAYPDVTPHREVNRTMEYYFVFHYLMEGGDIGM